KRQQGILSARVTHVWGQPPSAVPGEKTRSWFLGAAEGSEGRGSPGSRGRLSAGSTDTELSLRNWLRADNYALALAVSFTLPSATSTLYSTLLQPCCFRICSVFFCTKEVKLSREPEAFSPALFLAPVRAINSFSTLSSSAPGSVQCTTNGWSSASLLLAFSSIERWPRPSPYTFCSGACSSGLTPCTDSRASW